MALTASVVRAGDPATDTRLNNNMVSDAKDLPADLDKAEVLWKLEFRAKFLYGQPVVVGDRVLVGSDSRALVEAERYGKARAGLMCLDRKTGKRIWQMAFAPKGPWWAGHGVTSTPWVQGDRVYFLSADGQAVCMDLDGLADGNDGPFTDEARFLGVDSLADYEGDIIWIYDFSRKHRIKAHDSHSSDPLIVDGMFIFATGQAAGVKPTPAWTKKKDIEKWKYEHRPNLLALDKESGELIAQDHLDIPVIYHGQWSSPALLERGGRRVIVWGDGYGRLHGFDMPDREAGEIPLLWSLDLVPSEYRMKDGEPIAFPRHGTPNPEKMVGPTHVIAKPVVRDGKIYISTGRDHYYTGRIKGRIGTTGAFWCIDASDPADITAEDMLWETRLYATHSTASVTDDLVYVADGGGYLHCLDTKTGSTVWTHDLGHDVTCRSQLLADGKVYVGTDREQYFIFSAGREKKLLYEGKVDGRSATPGAVDGMLIIATPEGITAFGPAK
jgi:outer membrane protein assembly factor BamB